MPAARNPENRQELRLALALRGGASMAVWIGGATAEINCLRTAVHSDETPDGSEHGHPWAALAALAGYDSVNVDVLAGASAGGVNATLLSASIVYGMPFDRMRELWVRLADLEAMARPVPKFWQRRPESLLEGDDYFAAELARGIKHLVPPPGNATGLGDRVDLLLTATLLDPVLERRFDARAEAIIEPRRGAWFRFRHQGRPGDPLSDFGTGDTFDETVQRLASAGRTTSSFPAAFEPAKVYSGPGTPPPGVPNMFGMFSDVSDSLFRVIDGGVLDNIPVAAAIRSVAAAPADRPTQRWLVYLNPEPFEQPEKQQRLALPVAFTALSTRLTQESVLTDIQALDDHNAVVDRTALRRKALFAEIRSAAAAQRRDVLARQANAVLSDHAVVRAELDAQAVHALLTEPAGSEDGRLLPPVATDPLAGWSAQVRTRLSERLSACLGQWAAENPRAVFNDVRGLSSGIQECIDWARDAERWAPESATRELGACKAALYRLRVFADVLEGHADRYWISGAQVEPIVELSELDGWVDRVCRRRTRLQHHLPSPIRPLLGDVLAVWDGGDGVAGQRYQRSLKDFADELLSIVESSGADAVVDSGIADEDADHIDAVAEAWAVLDGLAARVSRLIPAREHWEQPEQIGYGLLEHATDEQRSDVLRDLVVLTAPLDVGRAPGSRIEFLRVVTDTQTPLPFDALHEPGAPLRGGDKVKGGSVGHFGAFLSAKWRANDWMWGRLDAAAGLVTLLLDPARLVRYNDDPEQLANELQAIAGQVALAELGPLDEEKSRQWREFLAERWAARDGEVRRELTALFARPDDTHPLTETRTALTERLHWTIVGRELPFVAATDLGTQPEIPGTAEVSEPDVLSAEVRGYSVGQQRVADLGERRTATMISRLSLIGYRAAKPSGFGILKSLLQLGMTALKPLMLLVAFAVAAPTRAALVGFLAATAAAFTEPLSIADNETTPDLDGWWPLAGLSGHGIAWPVAAVLAVVFAIWLGWQLAGRLSRGRGLARWLPTLFVAALLLAGVYGLARAGFGLGAPGFALAAVALTLLATFGYRPLGRLAATLVTAASFALAYALCPPFEAGWLVVATLVTAYAHVLLLGTVDVFPPRVRPERVSPPVTAVEHTKISV